MTKQSYHNAFNYTMFIIAVLVLAYSCGKPMVDKTQANDYGRYAWKRVDRVSESFWRYENEEVICYAAGTRYPQCKFKR